MGNDIPSQHLGRVNIAGNIYTVHGLDPNGDNRLTAGEAITLSSGNQTATYPVSEDGTVLINGNRHTLEFLTRGQQDDLADSFGRMSRRLEDAFRILENPVSDYPTRVRAQQNICNGMNDARAETSRLENLGVDVEKYRDLVHRAQTRLINYQNSRNPRRENFAANMFSLSPRLYYLGARVVNNAHITDGARRVYHWFVD